MKTNLAHTAFGLALLALAATGCTSVRPSITDAPPQVGHEFSTPERPVYTVSEATAMMTVSVEIKSGGEESSLFAVGVQETVFTALRDRKFQVVHEGDSDLHLGVSAIRSVFNNAAGEYFTLDGTVGMELYDCDTGKTLAAKIFRGRNKPSLGMDRAELDLAETMKPDIVRWIGEKVTPEQVPLEVRTLRVAQIDRYPGGESAFIDSFVKAMSAMKGVLRCETSARDSQAKTASFRVLYRRADYPQGFLHAVINQNPKFGLVLQ